MKRLFILRDPAIKERCASYIRSVEGLMQVTVEPHEKARNLKQNANLHAALSDIAEQLKWAGEYLDVDSWKRLFCAALHGQKVVPGLDGGFVVLNKHTSRMSKRECSELIDFVHAWGAERGVKFGNDEEIAA
jgi:hypothetical protein